MADGGTQKALSAIRHLPSAIGTVFAIASLCFLELVLYRKVLRLWWLYDDSQLLRTILGVGLRDEFFDRAVWPQQLFTPLMYAAFEGQWALFGFNPSPWYVVHLAIAFLAAVALFFAVRLFLDVPRSFAATALFLVGTPLCSLLTQLSTVHYFLAIGFGALAVIAFVKRAPALSALLYFAALLSKEIAAPLPLVLAFLPIRDRRTRLVNLIPHAVALAVYLLWRRLVIGAFFGDYSWSIDAREWPRLLLLFPWRVVGALAGAHLYLGVALLALIAALLLVRARTWLLAIALFAAIAPMLPLAKEIHPRYPVMPWLVLSIAVAAAVPKARYALTILALAIVVNRQEFSRELRARQQMSAEGRFFMTMPADALLRQPLTPPPNMRELTWLKTDYLHEPAGTCFYDDFFLSAAPIGKRRVFQYEGRTIVDVSHRVPQYAQQHLASIRWKAPLAATFHHRGQVLRWELGPYDDGKYSVLLGEGIEAWELPRRDALNLPGVNALALRVRYDSPQGWTTYSPVIALDFRKQPDVTWRR